MRAAPDVTPGRELLFDRQAVTVVRLSGPPRSGVAGRHRRLVAYVASDVTTAQLVRLLRDTADGLAKTLPKVAR